LEFSFIKIQKVIHLCAQSMGNAKLHKVASINIFKGVASMGSFSFRHNAWIRGFAGYSLTFNWVCYGKWC